MEVKLKSNRRFMLYISIPAVCFFTVVLLFLLIGQTLGLLTIIEGPGDLETLIMCIVFEIIGVLSTLIIILYKGKSYIFKDNSIEIYKNGKLIEKLIISEVERIDYYPFRWHYLITIFRGALPEGGAWKFHLLKYDTTKHLLGFISEKDAYRIKEIYPSKVNIIYERKCNI